MHDCHAKNNNKKIQINPLKSSGLLPVRVGQQKLHSALHTLQYTYCLYNFLILTTVIPNTFPSNQILFRGFVLLQFMLFDVASRERRVETTNRVERWTTMTECKM